MVIITVISQPADLKGFNDLTSDEAREVFLRETVDLILTRDNGDFREYMKAVQNKLERDSSRSPEKKSGAAR